MVSIEEARLILQDNKGSNKEIQEIIESLQLLVELMFETQQEDKNISKKSDN
jgi:hypothetical protein